MRVTKRGNPPCDRKWHGTCRKCEAEAEAVETELRVQDDTREGTQFAWHKCPVCGAGDDGGFGGMLFYPVTNRT